MFKYLSPSLFLWPYRTVRVRSRYDTFFHKLFVLPCLSCCASSFLSTHVTKFNEQSTEVAIQESMITRKVPSFWYRSVCSSFPVNVYSNCGDTSYEIMELYEVNRVFCTQQIVEAGPTTMSDVLERIMDQDEVDTWSDKHTFAECHAGVYQYAGYLSMGSQLVMHDRYNIDRYRHSFTNLSNVVLLKLLVNYFVTPHPSNSVSDGVCSEFTERLRNKSFSVSDLCTLNKVLTPHEISSKMSHFDCLTKIWTHIDGRAEDILDEDTLLLVYKSIPKSQSHVLQSIITNGVNWQKLPYPVIMQLLQIVKNKCPESLGELHLLSAWITTNPQAITKSLIEECLTICLTFEYVSLPMLETLLKFIIAKSADFTSPEWCLILRYCSYCKFYDQTAMDMASKHYMTREDEYSHSQLCLLLQSLGTLNFTRPQYPQFFTKVQSRLLRDFYTIDTVQMMTMLTSLLLMNRVPYLLENYIYSESFLGELRDVCIESEEHQMAFREFLIFMTTFLPGTDNCHHYKLLLLPTSTQDAQQDDRSQDNQESFTDEKNGEYHMTTSVSADEILSPETLTDDEHSAPKLTFAKDKTPMVYILELARFNEIPHAYKLINEEGPPHQRTFSIKLTLGDEEFFSSGSSLKKTKQAAALTALQNTSLPHPGHDNKPVDVGDDELNVAETKKTQMEVVHELAMSNNIPYEYKLEDEKGPPHRKTFFVTLHLGGKEFSSSGKSIQRAKHAAATMALKNNALSQQPSEIQSSDPIIEKVNAQDDFHCDQVKESLMSIVPSSSCIVSLKEFYGIKGFEIHTNDVGYIVPWSKSTSYREPPPILENGHTTPDSPHTPGSFEVSAINSSAQTSPEGSHVGSHCHREQIKILVPSAESFCANQPEHLLGYPATYVRLAQIRRSIVILDSSYPETLDFFELELNFHKMDESFVSKETLTQDLEKSLRPYTEHNVDVDWLSG